MYFGAGKYTRSVYRTATTSTLVDYMADKILKQCSLAEEPKMVLEEIATIMKYSKEMDNFPDYLIDWENNA